MEGVAHSVAPSLTLLSLKLWNWLSPCASCVGDFVPTKTNETRVGGKGGQSFLQQQRKRCCLQPGRWALTQHYTANDHDNDYGHRQYRMKSSPNQGHRVSRLVRSGPTPHEEKSWPEECSYEYFEGETPAQNEIPNW